MKWLAGGRALGIGLAVALALPSCEKEPAATVSPEQTYLLDVANPERPMGWTLTTDLEFSGEEMEITVTSGGRTVKGTGKMQNRSQEVLQVLAPTRRRVTVQLDRQAMVFSLEDGTSDEIIENGLMVRKFVVVENRDGNWLASLESGELPTVEVQEELDKISKEFNERGKLYGLSPRIVGEEWQADLSPRPGEEFLVDVRFDRVEEYEGQKCAVLTGRMHSVGQSLQNGQVTNVTVDIEFTTHRSLEDYEDLRTEGSGAYTVKMSPQLGVSVLMAGPVTMTQTATVTAPAH